MASFFEKLKINTGKREKPQKVKSRKIPEQQEVSPKPESKKEWPETEGQLAVDVFETDETLFIQSTIAGVKAEDLDITIENDMVTIKGRREKPDGIEKRNYFYQECYWGPFSRQIILPEEGDATEAEATLEGGVLTLRIPKLRRKQKKKIVVKEKD